MPDTVEPRHVPTKIKHTILREYLKRWGGIILTGMKHAQDRNPQKTLGIHLVYVDCFSSFGWYDGEIEEVERGLTKSFVAGSPLIGIETLEGLRPKARTYGVNLTINYICVESSRNRYNELVETLHRKGYTNTIYDVSALGTLTDGGIAAFHANAIDMRSDLINYTNKRYTKAFYFLDPYGPIPLDFVGQVIQQPTNDTMIYMPYAALIRRRGVASKATKTPQEQKQLGHYDKMFGNDSWRVLVEALESDIPEDEFDQKEIDLANLYKYRLKSQDSSVVVKSIPLRVEDRERVLYHLYLTTHNVDGALAMNQVIADAGYQENVLRWKLADAKKAKPGQLTMFSADDVAPTEPPPSRDTPEQIADQIYRNNRNSTLTFRDICESLVDEPYFRTEIEAALKRLKSSTPPRASFDASRFRNDTEIVFS
jgi:three-Cys-motif partner protein